MSERVNITGERVTLRAVEPSDIDVMYGLENDLQGWGVSGSTQPFSRYLLERFVESQESGGGDIALSQQLRLMVDNQDGEVVGVVDLFEYDHYNHRAGVGIYILSEYHRMGYGLDTLLTLERYCRSVLQIHQLWCGVAADNRASISLFERVGYREVGVKREWLWREGGRYEDELMMQRIL